MGSICHRMPTSSDDDELLTSGEEPMSSFCCFCRRSQVVAENGSSTTAQQRKAATGACKACKKSLCVFNRQKCADCFETHCADCLTLSTTSPNITLTPEPPRRRLCRKCGALSSGACTSRDLMTYTVHELRQYLERQEVSECHCTEKADLVELIIRINVERGFTSAEESAEHERHVEMLRERMLEHSQIFTTNHTSNNNRLNHNTRDSVPPVTNQPVPSVTNQPVPAFTNQPPLNDYSGVLPDVMIVSDAGRSSPQRPRPPATQSGVNDRDEGEEERRGVSDYDVRESEKTELNVGDELITEPISRRSVDRLTRTDHVDEMSMEQLRDILTRNGIEFNEELDNAGLVLCIRKLQAEQSQLTAERPGVKPLPLCRLCACSPIDCVLLDCGHMVTCRGCAQKLPECPVCQQFVVRTVHVFRA